MSIRIKDIAKEVGVDSSTVSRALNDRPGVNSELKAAIKKTAQRLGYAPYMSARETGMYDSQIKTIAVVYPRLGQHIVEKLQRGIDNILYQEGYFELRYSINTTNLLVNRKVENELIFQKLLSDKKIRGIIFAFFNISESLIAQFHKNHTHTVLLNNYTDYGKCITMNDYKSMHNAVTELIKLEHKKIGLIMPDENSEHIWRERLNGYKQGLKENKILYDPNLIINEHSFKLNEAGFVTKQLVKNNSKITAIIYGNDTQAYGGLMTLRDMKLKIPDDIAILGWDDMEFNQVIRPSLSSVHQPIEEMGETGAKFLIEAIKNKDYKHKSVELQTKLCLRGSCIKNYQDNFYG